MRCDLAYYVTTHTCMGSERGWAVMKICESNLRKQWCCTAIFRLYTLNTWSSLAYTLNRRRRENWWRKCCWPSWESVYGADFHTVQHYQLICLGNKNIRRIAFFFLLDSMSTRITAFASLFCGADDVDGLRLLCACKWKRARAQMNIWNERQWDDFNFPSCTLHLVAVGAANVTATLICGPGCQCMWMCFHVCVGIFAHIHCAASVRSSRCNIWVYVVTIFFGSLFFFFLRFCVDWRRSIQAYLYIYIYIYEYMAECHPYSMSVHIFAHIWTMWMMTRS